MDRCRMVKCQDMDYTNLKTDHSIKANFMIINFKGEENSLIS